MSGKALGLHVPAARISAIDDESGDFCAKARGRKCYALEQMPASMLEWKCRHGHRADKSRRTDDTFMAIHRAEMRSVGVEFIALEAVRIVVGAQESSIDAVT